MMASRRLQRSREAGARMPDGAVYVGRGRGSAGRFGNPFAVGGEAVRLVTVQRKAESYRGRQWSAAWLYAHWIAGRMGELPPEVLAAAQAELAAAGNPAPPTIEDIRKTIGFTMSATRDVVCWCPTHVDCHGDILRAVAMRKDPVVAAGSSPHWADNFRCLELAWQRGAPERKERRERYRKYWGGGWNPW